MNVYFKTFFVISLCVAVVGVVIQEIIECYKSEISDVLEKNPSLKVASQTVHDFFPVHKLLFSIFAYLPSLRNFVSFLQPSKSATPTPKKRKETLFTPEQLKKYDGQDESRGPYLAVLGRVYNVRKGKKFYGPGKDYGFLSGRDASRAFVSGDFSEAGLIDDVTGMSGTDYMGLDEWQKFYDSNYKYVGKLIGRFYDENGEPTPYNYEVQSWISEAYADKESDNLDKYIFPTCNSEWNPETGSRLWCTKKSGGVERDWVGVPRQFFKSGQTKSRCACVKNFGPPTHDQRRVNHDNRGDLDNPHLQEYPNCLPDQPECFIKLD